MLPDGYHVIFPDYRSCHVSTAQFTIGYQLIRSRVASVRHPIITKMHVNHIFLLIDNTFTFMTGLHSHPVKSLDPGSSVPSGSARAEWWAFASRFHSVSLADGRRAAEMNKRVSRLIQPSLGILSPSADQPWIYVGSIPSCPLPVPSWLIRSPVFESGSVK